MNSEYQPWNAEAASSMWSHTPVPTSSSSCITRSTSAGPTTPTIPFRVATENSTARLVNASIGSTLSEPGEDHQYEAVSGRERACRRG